MARPSIKFAVYSMTPDNRQRLQRQIGALEGTYHVEITPIRPTRSTQQNRFYWGVVIASFWEWLRDQDWTIGSDEAAHELLKARFLATSVVNKRTGEVIGRRVRSTTELTTEEFADYIERCRMFLMDYCGIVVPDPDPDYARKREVAHA